MQEYVAFIEAHPMLTLAWVVLFAALIVTMIKSAASKIITIDNQELSILVNRKNAKVVDVRGKEEFKKGHIVDALNFPLAEIKNNQGSMLEKFKSSPIILVCNSGVTSSQAAHLLAKQGFEELFNLKGGMGEWQSANLPVRKSKR